MKLEIYEAGIPVEEKVRLKFKKCLSGVMVIAVDERGVELERGKLVLLKSDGTLFRYMAVNKGLGFRLNKSGRVEESPQPETPGEGERGEV